MVLRHNIGAIIDIENVGTTLISESPGRVVVAVAPDKAAALKAVANTQQITITKIGTTGGTSLIINGADISLTELRKAHTETFSKLFG